MNTFSVGHRHLEVVKHLSLPLSQAAGDVDVAEPEAMDLLDVHVARGESLGSEVLGLTAKSWMERLHVHPGVIDLSTHERGLDVDVQPLAAKMLVDKTLSDLGDDDTSSRFTLRECALGHLTTQEFNEIDQAMLHLFSSFEALAWTLQRKGYPPAVYPMWGGIAAAVTGTSLHGSINKIPLASQVAAVMSLLSMPFRGIDGINSVGAWEAMEKILTSREAVQIRSAFLDSQAQMLRGAGTTAGQAKMARLLVALQCEQLKEGVGAEDHIRWRTLLGVVRDSGMGSLNTLAGFLSVVNAFAPKSVLAGAAVLQAGVGGFGGLTASLPLINAILGSVSGVLNIVQGATEVHAGSEKTAALAEIKARHDSAYLKTQDQLGDKAGWALDKLASRQKRSRDHERDQARWLQRTGAVRTVVGIAGCIVAGLTIAGLFFPPLLVPAAALGAVSGAYLLWIGIRSHLQNRGVKRFRKSKQRDDAAMKEEVAYVKKLTEDLRQASQPKSARIEMHERKLGSAFLAHAETWLGKDLMRQLADAPTEAAGASLASQVGQRLGYQTKWGDELIYKLRHSIDRKEVAAAKAYLSTICPHLIVPIVSAKTDADAYRYAPTLYEAAFSTLRTPEQQERTEQKILLRGKANLAYALHFQTLARHSSLAKKHRGDPEWESKSISEITRTLLRPHYFFPDKVVHRLRHEQAKAELHRRLTVFALRENISGDPLAPTPMRLNTLLDSLKSADFCDKFLDFGQLNQDGLCIASLIAESIGTEFLTRKPFTPDLIATVRSEKRKAFLESMEPWLSSNGVGGSLKETDRKKIARDLKNYRFALDALRVPVGVPVDRSGGGAAAALPRPGRQAAHILQTSQAIDGVLEGKLDSLVRHRIEHRLAAQLTFSGGAQNQALIAEIRLGPKMQAQQLQKVVASLHSYPTRGVSALSARGAGAFELRRRFEAHGESQGWTPSEIEVKRAKFEATLALAQCIAAQYSLTKRNFFAKGAGGGFAGLGEYALNRNGLAVFHLLEEHFGNFAPPEGSFFSASAVQHALRQGDNAVAARMTEWLVEYALPIKLGDSVPEIKGKLDRAHETYKLVAAEPGALSDIALPLNTTTTAASQMVRPDGEPLHDEQERIRPKPGSVHEAHESEKKAKIASPRLEPFWTKRLERLQTVKVEDFPNELIHCLQVFELDAVRILSLREMLVRRNDQFLRLAHDTVLRFYATALKYDAVRPRFRKREQAKNAKAVAYDINRRTNAKGRGPNVNWSADFLADPKSSIPDAEWIADPKSTSNYSSRLNWRVEELAKLELPEDASTRDVTRAIALTVAMQKRTSRIRCKHLVHEAACREWVTAQARSFGFTLADAEAVAERVWRQTEGDKDLKAQLRKNKGATFFEQYLRACNAQRAGLMETLSQSDGQGGRASSALLASPLGDLIGEVSNKPFYLLNLASPDGKGGATKFAGQLTHQAIQALGAAGIDPSWGRGSGETRFGVYNEIWTGPPQQDPAIQILFGKPSPGHGLAGGLLPTEIKRNNDVDHPAGQGEAAEAPERSLGVKP